MSYARQKWGWHGLVPLAALLVPGCTSEVVRVGPDSYHLSTTVASVGGGPFARLLAIEAADRYCAKQGQITLVTQFASASQVIQGATDITFRCVAATASTSNE